MYKNIKRIISLTTIIFSLTTIVPIKDLNLGIKAYAAASTYSDAKDGELTSLEIKSSDGKNLDLCDDYNGNKLQLTETKSYYVRLNTSDNKIIVSASVKGNNYVAKLCESDRKNATGHNMGETIDLPKGKTTLYLRTFTSEEAYKRAEDNANVTSSDKVYKIYVQNTDSTGQDKIYLNQLKVDGGNHPFDFDYQKSTYSVSVQENEDTVEIRATPANTDYTVKINDSTANEDNKYTRKVNLNKGKNEIKIRVQDNDIRENIYTLNIYRGIAVPTTDTTSTVSKTSTSTETATNNSNSTNVKANQWVQINNSWQYNDATGIPMKNTWFCDKSNGNNYYLQSNGALAIGWLNINGNWYYSNAIGVRQTGWQNINGQWYYLYSDGIMAKNTTVDGYKIGSDGAWIK